MLINLLCAFVLLMILLVGWIKVQSAARRLAQEHPEAGPFRLVGGGCGGHGHGDAADRGAEAHPPVQIVIASPPASGPRESSGGCSTCDNTACKAAQT